MRRCEDCRHSRCAVSMTPCLPDLWVCRARGGMGVLHPILRALTCRGYESRYRLRTGGWTKMAYGDYGAFVYLNGKRREDKEDVGVYDTDEASLPTGLRRFANIMKHPDGCEWFEHSHHGVMGDGRVRVGCHKRGWPELYDWEDGKDEPTLYTFDYLSLKFGWDDYREYYEKRYPLAEYDKEFDFLGWHFNFWGNDYGSTPKYGATMSRDGESWECGYDYAFGAGFDDTH